jgi:oligopeptidase B
MASKLAFFEDTSAAASTRCASRTSRHRRGAAGHIRASPNGVWADDNRTLFYVENDPETLLTVRVKAHRARHPGADDVLVYEEKDDSFYMGIGRTRDDQYICIGVQSTVSSEAALRRPADPGEFRVLAARERDVEYRRRPPGWPLGDPHQLDAARTSSSCTAPKTMPPRPRAVEGSDGARRRVFIEGFELFDGFMAVGALPRLLEPAHPPAQGRRQRQYVKADEPAYSMGLSVNAEPDTDWLRYSYTSLTTPASTYELNVATGERKLLKQQPVLGGYDPANYVTERVWAPARDGAQDSGRWCTARASRRTAPRAAAIRLRQLRQHRWIRASTARVVSLLDRGMVYAIAHIRGGQEMGRAWYEDGKLLKKMNTFTTSSTSPIFLVKQGYAARSRRGDGRQRRRPADGRGRQHGAGEVPRDRLAGAVRRRGHHHARRQHPADHQRVRRVGQSGGSGLLRLHAVYSPYDNVKAQAYPAMFVGTGLWDSQVQYFEPAKYVARLRAT